MIYMKKNIYIGKCISRKRCRDIYEEITVNASHSQRSCTFFFLIILPAASHLHKTVVRWTHQKPAVCQSGSLQEGAVEPPPYAERLLHLREKSGVDTSADLHPCACLPHSANKTKHKLNYTKTKENKSEM